MERKKNIQKIFMHYKRQKFSLIRRGSTAAGHLGVILISDRAHEPPSKAFFQRRGFYSDLKIFVCIIFSLFLHKINESGVLGGERYEYTNHKMEKLKIYTKPNRKIFSNSS